MRLVIDTETNGAQPDFGSMSTADHQPRLVQLAAVLETEDGQEVASVCVVVRPNGFRIGLPSAMFHGISQELAEKIGISAQDALGHFMQLARHATEVAGYSVLNDLLVIEGELRRALMPPCFPGRKMVCIERMIRPIMRVRPARPQVFGDEFAAQSLEAAHQFCFGHSHDRPHRAMSDARAASRIYRWIEAEKQAALERARELGRELRAEFEARRELRGAA